MAMHLALVSQMQHHQEKILTVGLLQCLVILLHGGAATDEVQAVALQAVA